MKSGELIVKSHRPYQRRLLVVMLCLGVIVGGWALYELGLYQGGFSRLAALNEKTEFESRIERSEAENSKLNEQITIIERTQEIDGVAYNSVRDNIKQLQEEILELRSEVDFYRGIVSPLERLAGLNIQTFKVDPAGEEALYHFELVVTQVLKNDRFVKGVVNLFVQGVQNGEPVSLNFSSISPNNSVQKSIRFRYFQKIEGDIRLPEGFVPRNAVVEMSPNGRKKISKSFPWVVSGG